MDSTYTSRLTPPAAALTELVLEVFRLNGRLLASGDQLVADLGLTSARWQVLGAIALAGSQLPVAHIARNMGLTRQAVQRVVNELAASDLVEFAPNPYHRRAHLVRLTPDGKRAFGSATGRQVPWANRLSDALPEPDIAAARDVLRTLVERLEASSANDAQASPLRLKGASFHGAIQRNGPKREPGQAARRQRGTGDSGERVPRRR